MIRIFFALLCGTFPFADCWALNDDGRISGNVRDLSGISLEHAVVLLLNASDSSYVAGCVTDSLGNYTLSEIRKGDFLIEVSMLGYKKQFVPVRLKAEEVKVLSCVALAEDVQMLSDVVVTAGKKPVELEAGKTVINLSSSISGSKGNAFDALKSAPGVFAREDGTIYLYGRQGVNVLVDNKLTYLSGESLVNFLRSLPASSVDKIELIMHPSSRYDASGNSGLINIQTKKVKIRGIGLAVYSNFQQGRYARGYESVNLSVRKEKLSFYANYSYNWGRDFMDVVSDRYYPLPEQPVSSGELTLSMTAARRMRYTSHFVRGGVSYDWSEKVKLDAYLTGNHYTWEKRETTDSRFYTSSLVNDSTKVTYNKLNVKHTNLTGGASFLYTFAGEGNWDISFDFQRFERADRQTQAGRFSTPSLATDTDPLTGAMNGNIDINTGQTNLTYPLTGKLAIDAGAKTAFISIGNEALYQNRQAAEWINNVTLSNSFYYDENINAAYVKLKASPLPSLSYEAGLRLENTRIKGRQADLTTKPDSLFSSRYTNLFPNITVQYKPAEGHAFSFLYGRRIARPNYRDLNPFIEVNDSYLYEQGNTNLKPEFSDNLEGSYFFKQQYGLSLQYSRKTRPIAKSYLMKDNRLVVVTPMNLRANHTYGARLSLNGLRLFAWWTAYVNASLTYKQFSWTYDGAEESNSALTLMAHLSNQLILPCGWTGEVTCFYNSRMAEGQAIVHSLGQVSLGLRKAVLGNKMVIQLFADDIFSTNRTHITLMGITNGWYKEKANSRVVGCLLTWRFNSGSAAKDLMKNNRIEESKRINL